MEGFQLVLLKRGPTRGETPETKELQRRHLAHLTKLGDDGKLVAGPFSNQRDPAMRGMGLFRVATPEEARLLAEADPMVQAGRLTVEVITWWPAMEFPMSGAAVRKER